LSAGGDEEEQEYGYGESHQNKYNPDE